MVPSEEDEDEDEGSGLFLREMPPRLSPLGDSIDFFLRKELAAQLPGGCARLRWLRPPIHVPPCPLLLLLLDHRETQRAYGTRP